MRCGSVCSGIEAATEAWHPLGWEAAFYSEIAAFPCAVLRHHYPSVPNLGDMTKFQEWPNESIDLLVGGTPCQSFSVAGLRKGLADPRGNLMLTYCAIAQRYMPRWVVWENVPGVLSSNGGRDFATLLRALEELGYGWAYRILDAQYFGVAQRRRRVFVVGYLGDWRPAAAVLFEPSAFTDDIEGAASRALSAPTLTCASSGNGNCRGVVVFDGKDFRALTPAEEEKRQGFPTDYTLIPYRGKPAPDDSRYKALGNSMAVPVMRWVGERIEMVENIQRRIG